MIIIQYAHESEKSEVRVLGSNSRPMTWQSNGLTTRLSPDDPNGAAVVRLPYVLRVPGSSPGKSKCLCDEHEHLFPSHGCLYV